MDNSAVSWLAARLKNSELEMAPVPDPPPNVEPFAEYKNITLGDLLEGIVLHAFEGKAPFSPQTLKEIEQFKKLYGLTLRATDSHHLHERTEPSRRKVHK